MSGAAWDEPGTWLPVTPEVIACAELPEPERSLLAHDRDMTGTLAGYFGQEMRLRVLAHRLEADRVRRRVLLVGADDGAVAEFGEIDIRLDGFDAGLRAAIAACRVPLGGLLRERGMDCRSRPSAFLRMRPTAALQEAMSVPPAREHLYGRRAELFVGDGRAVAVVTEVLPALAGMAAGHVQGPCSGEVSA